LVGVTGPGEGAGAGATTAARTGAAAEASRELGVATFAINTEHVPQKNSEPKIIARSRPAERLLFCGGAVQLGAGGAP
jgi:hypothetical protein